MYFLLTYSTNHNAGFSPHMRPTAKFRPIVHADWLATLGENRPDQRSQTFGGYADPPKSTNTFKLTRYIWSDIVDKEDPSHIFVAVVTEEVK